MSRLHTVRVCVAALWWEKNVCRSIHNTNVECFQKKNQKMKKKKKKKYNRRNQRKIPIWLNVNVRCLHAIAFLAKHFRPKNPKWEETNGRTHSNFLEHTAKSIANQPTIQSAIKFFSLSSNKAKAGAKSKWSMNSRGTHERTSAFAFVYQQHSG